MFPCHIKDCPHEPFGTDEELRIHLLFTHSFLKPVCENNPINVDWLVVQSRRKQKAWNRGQVKARTNKNLVPRWQMFWDRILGTNIRKDKMNEYQRNYQRTKYADKNSKYFKNRILAARKRYYKNRSDPKWVEENNIKSTLRYHKKKKSL